MLHFSFLEIGNFLKILFFNKAVIKVQWEIIISSFALTCTAGLIWRMSQYNNECSAILCLISTMSALAEIWEILLSKKQFSPKTQYEVNHSCWKDDYFQIVVYFLLSLKHVCAAIETFFIHLQTNFLEITKIPSSTWQQ